MQLLRLNIQIAMKRARFAVSIVAVAIMAAIAYVAVGKTSDPSPAAAPTSESQWVHLGPDGKLVYKTTASGDRIMDFSFAGYMGGGVALPNVPVKKIVAPSSDGSDTTKDDTAAIQAAIDEVAALPLNDGFRGAVLLEPGIFVCSQTIRIPASGVVLRGSGCGPGNILDARLSAESTGASEAAANTNTSDSPKSAATQITTIKLVGRPHLGISIGNRRGRMGGGGDAGGMRRNRPANADDMPSQPSAESQSARAASPDFKPFETTVAEKYVPSGTSTFQVADAKGLAIGDWIAIDHPVTDAWIKFMHMDDLVRDGRPQTWIRPGRGISAERKISAISGNTITIDVPLSDSYDANYLSPPGVAVSKIPPPSRITQSGIENLHIACPEQAINHTQAHYQAMRISGEDCWAKYVVCDETMNSVGISGRRITLLRVAVNRKAEHQGASKPAEFAPNGTQVLLDRCSVAGDNVWFIATGAGVSGPIVILNCTFRGHSDAESHQRWSTGVLYDNCQVPDGGITLRNRGSMGSGHGWTMGWGVVWNCAAKDYIIQNPPGAANWLIGSAGRDMLAPRPFGSGPDLPEGIVDSHDKSVAPQSLYLTQLAQRLGPQAVKNIGY